MRARAAGLTLLAAAVLARSACSNAPLSKQGQASAVRAAASEPPPAVSVTLPESPLSEDQYPGVLV